MTGLLRLLKNDGWTLDRFRGSHHIMVKEGDRSVAFAIWLQLQRKKRGMTQQQIAQRLHIAYQTYQRFEDPAKSNPTLKTIAKIEQVLEEELLRV